VYFAPSPFSGKSCSFGRCVHQAAMPIPHLICTVERRVWQVRVGVHPINEACDACVNQAVRREAIVKQVWDEVAAQRRQRACMAVQSGCMFTTATSISLSSDTATLASPLCVLNLLPLQHRSPL
jgi:hypothetical protein